MMESPNSDVSINEGASSRTIKTNGSPVSGLSETDDLGFQIPPEAPAFYPTEEEFQDPLAYINKIRSVAETKGICKIKPPPNWRPPFVLNYDKFRFTPRIQKLNKIEAEAKIKCNFLDRLAKFWKLRGLSLKIPAIENRALDLYTLLKLVHAEGGSDVVTKKKRWAKITVQMGCYSGGKELGSDFKVHFKKLLYLYEIYIRFVYSVNDIDMSYKTVNDTLGEGSSKMQAELINVSNTKLNAQLKRLQFDEADAEVAGCNVQNEKKRRRVNPYCPLCRSGYAEQYFLLCCNCNDSYHTFCLIPPLPKIPEEDWQCPKCVIVEVSELIEAFRFEPSQKYSLPTFCRMADKFKTDHFNMPARSVHSSVVEKEFWRIVSSVDEDVTVKYGRDLYTMAHGSGFPTQTLHNSYPKYRNYIHSNWNLNNFPVLEGSLLGYIQADVLGMTVPRIHVGMCFATYCWHTEDHWSYSINYLHWGESKTWYGVPGSKAVAFEETIKSAVPELFQSQPDLLYQLPTIMNPNILMNAGVPVYRMDQHVGEFVVTFPRAYHAGFDQGYNISEEVNFASTDWLKMGRECVLYYSDVRHFCVFSHDELVLKIALESEKLTPSIAAATLQDMLQMVETEKELRKNILEWGVTDAERISYTSIPDDKRQCKVCKTTYFLSSIHCKCSCDSVCLRHYVDLCRCPPSEHILYYNYTLYELQRILQTLTFDMWLNKVKDSLDPTVPSTQTLNELKGLLTEAEEKRFPKCKLLTNLACAIEDAHRYASVIRQLDSTMAGTRTRNPNDRKYLLNLDQLNQFVEEIDSLSCVLEESRIIKDLLNKSNKFEDDSRHLLQAPLNICSVEEIENCLEYGEATFIELPSLKPMRQRLCQLQWLAQVTSALSKPDVIKLETIRSLLITGESVSPDILVKNDLQVLRKLLCDAEDWEQRANAVVSLPTSNIIPGIKELLVEARNIKVFLPTKQFLVETLNNM